jgi:hypothetical protein
LHCMCSAAGGGSRVRLGKSGHKRAYLRRRTASR